MSEFDQGSKDADKNDPEKENFAFPDGGWVCSQCQNYNFAGRVRCNRCTKQKAKTDFNGKPKHLLKKGKGGNSDSAKT